MDTPTSPKVTAAALAAALATIVLWIIEAATGIDIPAVVEGAATVVLTFAAGWIVTDPLRTVLDDTPGRHVKGG